MSVYVMNADGTHLKRITTGEGVHDRSPRSPNGSMIRSPLEPSGELEPQGIWVVEVESGELLQLTKGPILDQDPSWAAEGSRVVLLLVRYKLSPRDTMTMLP